MGAPNSKNMRGLEREIEIMSEGSKHHFVSFYNVKKHPEFIEATKFMGDGVTYQSVPRSLLNKILRDYGLDVEKGYQILYCIHRAYDNSIQRCPRFGGFIRSDPFFLNYVEKNTGIQL